MPRFEIKVILERPNRPREIQRVSYIDIPGEELEGLRERDYYLYAKVQEIELSAIEVESERLRAQYEDDSYAKLMCIAGIDQRRTDVKA